MHNGQRRCSPALFRSSCRDELLAFSATRAPTTDPITHTWVYYPVNLSNSSMSIGEKMQRLYCLFYPYNDLNYLHQSTNEILSIS